jgi:hypothetical protein
VETRNSVLLEARTADRLPDAVRARLVRRVGREAPAAGPGAWRAGTGIAVLALVAIVVSLLVPGHRAFPGVPPLVERPVVREVTGEVFCLRCALARLFPDTPVLDERHLPVLRTDDGEVITLLDGAVTGVALSRKGCAGRRVALTLRLFPRQELAEVLAVRSLGPSEGVAPGDVVAAASLARSSSR